MKSENVTEDRFLQRKYPVKNELFMGLSFVSLHEVKEALERAVYFYNNLRPHGSIGMLTPKEAAKQKGDLKKNWTSYREKYIKSL